VAKLAGVSGRQAVNAFVRAGWQRARQKGSHAILKKRGRPNLVIPMHRTLAPFLLRSQIRRAGLTEEQFLKFLK
jgi:predicted RNA binding protein YcfA (HicA-like mRNA interferase family)